MAHRDAPLTPEGEAMLADVTEVESEADKLGYFEQKVALRKNIEEQMLELFRFLHDSGASPDEEGAWTHPPVRRRPIIRRDGSLSAAAEPGKGGERGDGGG